MGLADTRAPGAATPLIPEQCRAARALLGWSFPRLVGRSGVNEMTLRHFEAGRERLTPAQAAALRRTFEAEGAAFGPDGGAAPARRGAGRPVIRSAGEPRTLLDGEARAVVVGGAAPPVEGGVPAPPQVPANPACGAAVAAARQRSARNGPRRR
jgi:hypothetical protein